MVRICSFCCSCDSSSHPQIFSSMNTWAKVLHNYCKNGCRMRCTLTCSTVVVFLVCLGTNMHQFSIRLPNTPNTTNNPLFYCCLCVASWYTYDRAWLRISLAFSILVWRLHECLYSSWTGRGCLTGMWLHQGSVVWWIEKAERHHYFTGPSLPIHSVDSLHYFTSTHIVYVYYNISDIVFIPQMLWAFWRC